MRQSNNATHRVLERLTGGAAFIYFLMAHASMCHAWQGAPNAQSRVNAIAAGLQNAATRLAALDGRTEPLVGELNALIDQAGGMQSVEAASEKDDDPPRKIEFRPPIERLVQKPTVLFILENGRLSEVDVAAVNRALQPAINSRLRGHKGKFEDFLRTSTGDFDVRLVGTVTKSGFTTSLEGRAGLERKSGASARGHAIEHPNVARALQKVAPGEQVIQCAVYPDSFDAYRQFRRLARERKIEINWIPFKAGESVPIGSGGGGVAMQ